MIKILLVDDHVVVRSGLRKLLDTVEGFKVVAEANSGEQALELVGKFAIDVILMDILMQGISGLEATRRILQTSSNIKVIVLSSCAQDPYPYHLTSAGAKGYLTKSCSIDEIIKAIYKVNNGEIYFESKIAEQLALKTINKQNDTSLFSLLSQREMQVVLMLLEAYTITKIAEKLHLSKKTVSTYRSRLLQKLGIKNNVELMRLAIQYNVLEKPIDT